MLRWSISEFDYLQRSVLDIDENILWIPSSKWLSKFGMITTDITEWENDPDSLQWFVESLKMTLIATLRRLKSFNVHTRCYSANIFAILWAFMFPSNIRITFHGNHSVLIEHTQKLPSVIPLHHLNHFWELESLPFQFNLEPCSIEIAREFQLIASTLLCCESMFRRIESWWSFTASTLNRWFPNRPQRSHWKTG